LPGQPEQLLQTVLDGREAPQPNSYVLYQEGPFEKVYEQSFVRFSSLAPGRFTGTFVKRNGEPFEVNVIWAALPAVLRSGQTLTIPVETNQRIQIYVLTEKVADLQPGPRRDVVLRIPAMHESGLRHSNNELSVRFVLFNNRMMEAGWEYRYESNFFERGVMLPIQPRAAL